ncbi:MAG: M15 family metallopeptidase [Bacteriovoracaceae bacterium]|nr:M15 family metallopeptidase [Bacteriovoracaceae bacterium]
MGHVISELTGKTGHHLEKLNNTGPLLHREVIRPFKALQSMAQENGFELSIASAYRSFDTQLSIWNAKARGEKKLLDKDGHPMDYNNLSKTELLFAILTWSALPGFSRHHWGTDIDIFDKNSLPSPDYQIQLIDDEVKDGGIFGPLHIWLDKKISTNTAHGFLRPYQKDSKGVMPERWHISHFPTAKRYIEKLTLQLFSDTMDAADILLKKEILEHRHIIFDRFITPTNQ